MDHLPGTATCSTPQTVAVPDATAAAPKVGVLQHDAGRLLPNVHRACQHCHGQQELLQASGSVYIEVCCTAVNKSRQPVHADSAPYADGQASLLLTFARLCCTAFGSAACEYSCCCVCVDCGMVHLHNLPGPRLCPFGLGGSCCPACARRTLVCCDGPKELGF